MSPKIIQLSEKYVIGMKSTMNHGEFGNIVALWKRFMPNRNLIQTKVNNEFIALQVYSDFNDFEKLFDIWACVEVSNLQTIPKGMTSFTIPEGEYAIFLHKCMVLLKV